MDAIPPLSAYVTYWIGSPADDVAAAVEELAATIRTVSSPRTTLEVVASPVRRFGRLDAVTPRLELPVTVRCGPRRWRAFLEVTPFSHASADLGLRPRRARPHDARWLSAAGDALAAVAALLPLPERRPRPERVGATPSAPARRPA